MSIRCITRPPSILPSGLASFGSTASTISEHDALTGFPGSPVLESITSLSAGRFFDGLGIAKSHSELPFAALGSRRSTRAIVHGRIQPRNDWRAV